MTSQPHGHPLREFFVQAREEFEAMLGWADSDGADDHDDFERQVVARIREVGRLVYQGRLNRLSAIELANWLRLGSPSVEGVTVRARTRQLESTLGRLYFRRLGFKTADKPVRFPADETLHLPADLYTSPLGEFVAEEVAVASFDCAEKRVDELTGGHVPHRQAEQLAVKAAQDFEAFYASRSPANDCVGDNAHLMGSADNKGIRMIPSALREATRKAKEAEEAQALKGDPMAKEKPRPHDRRMASVTATWEQMPMPRTADDIVEELKRRPRSTSAVKRKLPRPQNKRVWASVILPLSACIATLFGDLDRRDCTGLRCANILVDGDESQLAAILVEASRRKRPIFVLVDIIHVIHYMWCAGYALCRKNKKVTTAWVERHLRILLTTGPADLIAAIKLQANTADLSRNKKVVDAVRYFDRHQAFMDYQTALAKGLPIATGVIEGACRHLVQDRLGITGARWALASAEAVLRLRALHSSGDWDAYWRFHRGQEQLRNYGKAA